MFNKIFGSKRSKIISMVVCAAMAITLLGVFVSNTFAQANPIEVPLSDPNPDYFHLEVGVTRNRTVSGAHAWTNSNDSILTLTFSTQNRGTATLVAKQAGTTVVTVGSQQGDLESFNYQITDSRNISKYVLTKRDESYFKNVGETETIAIDTYSGTTGSEKNTAYAKSSITWTSLNENVAKMEGDTIRAIGNGAAMIVGEFTDKWGVTQHIHYLVCVGTNINGLLDGLLKDTLEKAESLNQQDYTPESWTDSDLSALINEGKDLLNNSNATDEQLSEMIKDLVNSMNSLVEKANKDELSRWIETAEGLKEADYTPASWADSNIVEVIADAKEVLNDTNATKQDVLGAIEQIRQAIEKLEVSKNATFEVNPEAVVMGTTGSYATKTFTATSKSTGQPVAVKWSIYTDDRTYADENDEVGTPITLKSTIDPNTGKLTIASNEAADIIVVVATLISDESQKVKAYVFIVDEPAAVIPFPELTGTDADIGKTFVADGYCWLVLDRDANGNLLITTKTIVSRSVYNVRASSAYNYYPGSSLDIAQRNFYTTRLNTLKAYAQPAIFPVEPAGTSYRNKTGGMSYVSASGTKTTFALSITEAFQCPGWKVNASYEASNSKNDSRRIATGYDKRWWTRTPYNASNAFYVGPTGYAGPACLDCIKGVRPAMWINPKGNVLP